MQLRSAFRAALGTIVLLSVSAITYGDEGNYLIHHATNLGIVSDTVVNVINSGSSNGGYFPDSGGAVTGNGNVCLNVYALNANGGLAWCCQCILRPDTLTSLDVNNDVGPNMLGPSASLVIKLIATAQGTNTSVFAGGNGLGNPGCNAGIINAGFASALVSNNVLAGGLTAWARGQITTANPTGTESAFERGQIVTNEVTKLTTACAVTGPGFGLCGPPTVGAPFVGPTGFCRIGGQ
jgi:hypothetical protein